MQTYMVAAVDEDGCIGKDGKIPWHYPEDLRAFKQLTTGHAVVMGRKTYESLPPAFRPLPNRVNIVLSRSEAECRSAGNHYRAGNIYQALVWYRENRPTKLGRVFFIGGAEIYKAALPYTDILHITHIPGKHRGDTFFPLWPIDETRWYPLGTINRDGLDVSSYSNLAGRVIF